jgi:hypothetical protein
MRTRQRFPRLAYWAIMAVLTILIAMPVTAGPKARPVSDTAVAQLSGSVAAQYWLANPSRAPAQLGARLGQLQRVAGAVKVPRRAPASAGLFNSDGLGLPQNEESIAACTTNPRLVLGGTNDFRGLFDPGMNSTGWQFSRDGGASLLKEGLLPAVTEGGTATRPSIGDPVDRIGRDGACKLYASSVNFDPQQMFSSTMGIGLHLTDRATLASRACGNDGLSDPDCWPTRRYAAFSSDPTHFFDKEWIDVGDTGDGEHVWVTYTDFDLAAPNPAGVAAEIFAVRCRADLAGCTRPIPVSVDDGDVQDSYVTIGPDGRTYVTWSQIQGAREGTAQVFTFKLRIAERGTTRLGPERVIFREELPLPFGGHLHAVDFRTNTVPKNAVLMVKGVPRVFLVWDACRARPEDFLCEEPVIKLTHSDNDGASWTAPSVLSRGGDNYFPTIAAGSNKLAVAWYTNRFDPRFHNRQDVELATLARSGVVTKLRRLTKVSNETEADPVLGGGFIGDYFEVAVHRRTVWVHFNANFRQIQFLGQGFPIPQQDNFLKRVAL